MPSELHEALTASGASALIPKQIDPFLQEQVRRFSPLLMATPSVEWDTNTFYFNVRTALPNGGNVADGGARSITNSTYTQSNFPIALYQTLGGVTGFAQAVTRGVIGDLKAKEEEGALMSQQWDIETGICWGNAAATASGQYPQHDSLDSQVNTYSGSSQNAYQNSSSTAVALSNLDTLIASITKRAAMPVMAAPWMFVMSPSMKLAVEALLTNNQRFLGEIEVAAGLLVPSYKGVPIVESSFVGATGIQMGTVSHSTASTGGTIADSTTNYYQISAVFARSGLSQASTEVSQATGTPGTNTSAITLTFSTPTGPDSAGPILYKVYSSTTTGTETLIGVVDAYDKGGTAVTSIIDTGTNLLTNSSGQTGPSAYVGANGQKPRGASDEDIFLVPQDEDYLVRPYIRDCQVEDLARTSTAPDTLPFAVFSDTAFAIRGAKYVARYGRVTANGL
jgi:hypothetical protein